MTPRRILAALGAIALGLAAAGLLWPQNSAASTWMDRLAADFKPIDGYVVQGAGDEWVIDLDRERGIGRGDLFGVLEAGQKLVHPATGEEIGRLETRKAVLQVTRVMDGYSFAKALEGAERIAAGDRIRRFEKIPALFWDYSGGGRKLAEQLAAILPHLEWQGYEAAQGSRPASPAPPDNAENALVFIFTGERLEVRRPDFLLLQAYAVRSPSAPDAAAVKTGKGAAAAPTVAEPRQKKTAGKAASAIAYSAVLADAETIGNLERVTLYADFYRRNGELLLAATDGSNIFVDRIAAKKLVPVIETDTPVPARILALSWWHPEPRDPPHLAVITWYDDKVRSMIFRLQDARLHLVQDQIDRILGAFDIDADGRPETLLGQRLDREDFYGRDIKALALQSGRLVYDDPPLQLPARFTVVGAAIADLTGNGRVETAFVRNGILYIYSGKQRIYESSKEMGGSLSNLTYAPDPQRKDFQLNDAFFEVAPAARDLDGDGRPELLAVASDRPAVSSPGLGLRADRYRLAVLKFQDGRFVKGRLEGEMDQAVQGLTVADERVLFVISEPGSLWGKKGYSHVLGYPLARR